MKIKGIFVEYSLWQKRSKNKKISNFKNFLFFRENDESTVEQYLEAFVWNVNDAVETYKLNKQ